MKTTTITCDAIGCCEDAVESVDCCHGYKITESYPPKVFKPFEKPLTPQKTDLCDKHYKEWCKLTCKLLKMDKEIIKA